MLLNNVLMLVTDLHLIEPYSREYFAWCFGGVLTGAGIATFPLITNVHFWSQHTNTGANQGKFGGLSNITPGIFFVALAFIL